MVGDYFESSPDYKFLMNLVFRGEFSKQCPTYYSDRMRSFLARLSADLNKYFNSESKSISSIFDKHFLSLDKVLSSPNSESLLQTIIDAYSRDIGNSSSGAVGNISKSRSKAISFCNSQFKSFINQKCSPLDDANAAVAMFKSEFGSTVASFDSKIFSHISVCNTRFSDKVNSISDKLFSKNVNSAKNVYVKNILDAKNHCFTMSDPQAAASYFNTKISESNSVFSLAITKFKFSGKNPTPIIDSAYSDIRAEIISASGEILSHFHGTPVSGSTPSQRASSVASATKAVISQSSNLLNVELSGHRSLFLSRLKEVDQLVDPLLTSAVPTTFIDSPMLVRYWDGVKSNVDSKTHDFISSAKNNFSKSFDESLAKSNSAINAEIPKFSNSLSLALTGFSDVEEAAVVANDDVTDSVQKTSHDFQDIADKYRSDITELSSSVSSRVSDKFRKLKTLYPRIRILGNISIPTPDVNSDDFPIQVDVANVGDSEWKGYFGVRFVDDYNNTFTYDNPADVIVIAPDETRRVTINVPFKSVIGDKKIGKSIKFYFKCFTMFDPAIIQSALGVGTNA